MMRAIGIVDYDPAWPMVFQRLRGEIAARLGALALEIEHVGSTAVPGLAAKPKIDIDTVVSSDAAIVRMQAFDYVFHGDRYDSGMWCFTRGHGAYGERLYLCAPGTQAHLDRLRFRDHLRAHPAAAACYGDLKRRLALEAEGDWDHYTGGKSPFIAEILRLAILPEADRKKADGRPGSAGERMT